MAAEHAAIDMNNIAGLGRARAQALDHLRIAPGRHKADVLAVGLVGDRQSKIARKPARRLLRAIAEGKAQEGKLLGRGRKQEIALIALLVGGAVKLPSKSARLAPDIMAGRERRRPEPFGRLKEIAELDLLVAGDAGNRRLALKIAVGELTHHRLGEARLVIEYVMGNLKLFGHAARILDVLSGAARPLPADRLSVIVKLKGNAHDIIALLLQESGHDGRIHTSRHSNDHAGPGWASGQVQAVQHSGLRRCHGLKSLE